MFGKTKLTTASSILLEDDILRMVDTLKNHDSLKGAILITLSGDKNFYNVAVTNNIGLGEVVGALDLAKHDIEHNGVPRL